MSTPYLITYYWEAEDRKSNGYAYDIATDPVAWVIRVNESHNETHFLLNAEPMTREQSKYIDKNGLKGT